MSWPLRTGVAMGAVGLVLSSTVAVARPIQGTQVPSRATTSVGVTPPPVDEAPPSTEELASMAQEPSSSEVDTAPPVDPLALACVGPITTTDADPGRDWQTVVVDPVHRLPEAWAPRDLVELPELGYRGADVTRVRAVVEGDLRAMHAAAADAGAPFVVVSGFRSEREQAALWRAAIEAGEDQGPAPGTARPGHSEHQLGTTIDVVDPSLPQLVAGLSRTPAGRWLAAHAADYGFVVTYPDGASDRTCFKPEPWHLRYVGVELTTELAATDLTLREFLLAG